MPARGGSGSPSTAGRRNSLALLLLLAAALVLRLFLLQLRGRVLPLLLPAEDLLAGGLRPVRLVALALRRLHLLGEARVLHLVARVVAGAEPPGRDDDHGGGEGAGEAPSQQPGERLLLRRRAGG